MKKLKNIRAKAHRTFRNPTLTEEKKLKIILDTAQKHRDLLSAFPYWEERKEFHEKKMASFEQYLGGPVTRSLLRGQLVGF